MNLREQGFDGDASVSSYWCEEDKEEEGEDV